MQWDDARIAGSQARGRGGEAAVWRKRREAGGDAGGHKKAGQPRLRGLRGLFARRVDRRHASSVPSATVPEAILLPEDSLLHEGRSSGAMASVYCSRCSRPNPDTSRFCSNCGAPLIRAAASKPVTETTSMISLSAIGVPAADPGEDLAGAYAALDAPPHDGALLLVTPGPHESARLLRADSYTSAARAP